MPGPERDRPFSVADGMLFVAAVGLGLGGGLVPFFGPPLRTGWHFDPIIGSVWLALAMSLATLFARLRRPRPSWARLARQPGFVACLAVAAAVVGAVWASTDAVLVSLVQGRWKPDPRALFWTVGVALNWNSRYAILGAWSIQSLTGRWRPEPCWHDRLGLAIAGYWLAAPTLTQLGRLR